MEKGYEQNVVGDIDIYMYMFIYIWNCCSGKEDSYIMLIPNIWLNQ